MRVKIKSLSAKYNFVYFSVENIWKLWYPTKFYVSSQKAFLPIIILWLFQEDKKKKPIKLLTYHKVLCIGLATYTFVISYILKFNCTYLLSEGESPFFLKNPWNEALLFRVFHYNLKLNNQLRKVIGKLTFYDLLHGLQKIKCSELACTFCRRTIFSKLQTILKIYE
jgi:hypothetical protein